VHPFHEVERDEEEFVACAHEEQSTLFYAHDQFGLR
jgi:hypothetical protein